MARVAVDSGNGVRAQLRQPRIAEIVADALRQRIIGGEMGDGEMLPSQERLLDEFRVSKPSIREALRILEAEGLITVQRGNVGGAVVHRPQAEHAAYTLALVLESKRIALDDVGEALKNLEGVCAGLCAAREDRLETVVPYLTQANQEALAALDDELLFVEKTAEFHRELVARCGNGTMSLVAGAIESLWLAHVSVWAEFVKERGNFPDRDYRRQGVRTHEKITRLIEKGDVNGVVRLACDHVNPEQFHVDSADGARVVSANALRVALP